MRRTARALGRASRETGFFYISGHGMSPSTLQTVFDASHAFFGQPTEEKNRLAMSRLGRNRGYVGLGVERLDTRSKPDHKEAFNISLDETDADSVWPDIPGWRDIMRSYFSTCLDLGAALHRGFARDLGVEEDFFRKKFSKSASHAAPTSLSGSLHLLG